MLNPFPIQFLALLAYALLRIFVGAIFLNLGLTHVRKRYDMRHALRIPLFSGSVYAVWLLVCIELIVGTMFILGFYTQIAALVAMGLSLISIVLYRRLASPYVPDKIFYVLLFAASLSLFITGAGALAFDLPI